MEERTPPFNESAERAVLGSILLAPDGVMYLCGKHGITEDSFYVQAHRITYAAMVRLRARPRSHLDAVTVADELNRTGQLEAAGGALSLERMIDATPTAEHAEYYIEIVADCHVRRRAIAAVRKAELALHDMEAPDIDTIGHLSGELATLRSLSGLDIATLHSFKDGKIEQWRAAKGKGYVGIPTSFNELNKVLGGWRKRVMSIIGGYRGQGKSTLARQECLWLAKQGYRVALFSLEDPGDIAAAGMVGNHANVSTFALDTGSYRDPDIIDRMEEAWDQLKDVPLKIVAGSMTVDQIIATANAIRRQYGLDILFIDHIQLIKPYELPHTNRNNTLAVYSQAIVALTQSLDIPIVCLSQLSRSAEHDNRAPMLSDLRDSGTLEQDARQVILLYVEDDHYVLDVAKNNFGVSAKRVNVQRLDGKQRFEELPQPVNRDVNELIERIAP